jgi:hypothetical protein
VGCRGLLDQKRPILRCYFEDTSFELQEAAQAKPALMSVPCRSRYHEDCFKLSRPFVSRLAQEKGLCLPTGFAAVIPAFICECCTVRAVLKRELTAHSRDRGLMLLERMRILDTAHNWAPGTINQYRGKLTVIRKFEQTFHCQVLRQPRLTRPPAAGSIPLMWAQQHYSLQTRKWTRSTAEVVQDGDRVCFNTVRGIRSAASLYNTWMSMLENPGQVIREKDSARPLQVEGCIPTDGLDYTMMTTGMSRRLGTGAKPAVALLGHHIKWINDYLNKAYHQAPNFETRYETVLAGLCNLLSWLAWLRGGETFGVKWSDFTVLCPGDGEKQNLAATIGAIQIRLLEQTKTCRSSVADVAVAFCTGSGLNLGTWLLRAREMRVPGEQIGDTTNWRTDDRLIFRKLNGQVWDSGYYRNNYLLPLLQLQRIAGDPYLQSYDGSAGRTLAEAFYSMHSYRIGARSHVSSKRPGCTRRATLDEINEHGRWRHRRSSESMAEQYRQWTLAERLAITLLCM